MSKRWPAFLLAPISVRLALGWLVAVLVVGAISPLLSLPYAPTIPDLAHIATPPTWAGPGPLHYLGTDATGRDVLAELLAGARQLLLLSLPAAAVATVLGALAGGGAGFWGNRQLAVPAAAYPVALAVAWWLLALPYRTPAVFLLLTSALVLVASLRRNTLVLPSRFFPLDSVVLGSTTLLSAIPRLVLVVALAAGPPLSRGLLLAILVLAAWPDAARLVRAQMMRVREQPFIEAARAAGLPAGRIWWRHALPHACQPLWAYAPLSLAGLIGLESTLSFLGIGLLPTTSSWGQLLGSLHHEPTAWWLAVGPGLALLFTLLALQSIAHWLSAHQYGGIILEK